MESISQQAALEIVGRLQQAGYEGYFAGGSVRDRLMGLEPKDIDVATSAKPDEILRLFPRGQKVGAAFGVILVRRLGQPIAVATFRADGRYEDGRHPVDITFSTAQGDAQRRDFTCNGLFWDPIAQVLYDYVGGQRDIEAKVLRAIGDPVARFAEDHLRILRAVRFAARLNFTIDPLTWEAMRQLAANIAGVSRERIGEELRHILHHPSRARAVRLMADCGLLAAIWPLPVELVGEERRSCLATLPQELGFAAALAALCSDYSKPLATGGQTADALRRALMLSGQETADITWLFDTLTRLEKWGQLPVAALKRLLAHRLSEDLLYLHAARCEEPSDAAMLRRRADELIAEGVAPEPWITGADLIVLGAAPGPRFKQWLDTLYDLQLENRLSDREAALAMARRLLGVTAAGG